MHHHVSDVDSTRALVSPLLCETLEKWRTILPPMPFDMRIRKPTLDNLCSKVIGLLSGPGRLVFKGPVKGRA